MKCCHHELNKENFPTLAVTYGFTPICPAGRDETPLRKKKSKKLTLSKSEIGFKL